MLFAFFILEMPGLIREGASAIFYGKIDTTELGQTKKTPQALRIMLDYSNMKISLINF